MNTPDFCLKEGEFSGELNLWNYSGKNKNLFFYEKLEHIGKKAPKKVTYICKVPDINVELEVAAYVYDKEQERILNKLSRDVYKLQRFAFENIIPTVWIIDNNNLDVELSIDFFYKMALIFERIEIHGNKYDSERNLSLKCWLESLTPDKIDMYCQKFNINTKIYCSTPYFKTIIGLKEAHQEAVAV